MTAQNPVLGIDLGTTRSVTAYAGPDGHVTCLPDRDGELLTPSCVLIQDDGSAVVGRRALEAALHDPEDMAEAFKRHMGQSDWTWSAGGSEFTAPALSALLLRRLVEDAERIVGPISGAVITVPAYFGDRERSATLEAAALADLDVISLVNEPTAAALAGAFEAYLAAGGDGADLTTATIASTAPGISVLCDLGGGTFDVTAIRIDGNRFDILATGGKLLGGRDFDDQIVEALNRHIFDCDGPDPFHDQTAQARMRLAAEQAKHALTVQQAVQVTPPYPRLAAMELTRQRFEEDSVSLIDDLQEVINGVMADAKLAWAQVDALLLVGGASRMPMFRRMVGQVSGLTPQMRLQPDLIVAHGAAVYGAILQAQTPQPGQATGTTLAHALDAVPPEPDDDLADGLPEPATAAASDRFEPGFAAAAGAVQVNDVTSQSLGVTVYSPEEGREVNAVVIPRNSRLPALRSRVFATHEDDQRRVVVPILEGQQRDPAECVEIGRCVIDNLPPNLPRGSRVEVTFSYDASGRVCVRAEEKSTRTTAQTQLERYVSTDQQARNARLQQLAAVVAEFTLA